MGVNVDELRMAVIFRADIDMPRGKAEDQFGHAVGRCLVAAPLDLVADYLAGAETKLSLEVAGLSDLERIADRARARGVVCALIQDAGRTVFAEPTITCLGLGPMGRTDSNALTRDATMR